MNQRNVHYTVLHTLVTKNTNVQLVWCNVPYTRR